MNVAVRRPDTPNLLAAVRRGLTGASKMERRLPACGLRASSSQAFVCGEIKVKGAGKMPATRRLEACAPARASE